MNILLTDCRTAATEQSELLDDIVYPQRVHWFADTYERTRSGMFYVPHRLADKVLDPALVGALREDPATKAAFILAAGNSHFAGINARPYPANRLGYVYKFLPFTLTQVYAGRVAQALGITDLVTTDASACASSLKVMMDAQNLIHHHGFERVVVLAVEDGVSNSVLEFFGETRAVLTAEQEAQGMLPSAFDSRHRGFRVGQGAVLAVFESARAAERRGAEPIAELLGACSASEASTNAIGEREDGQGFVKAIAGTLEAARVSPSDVAVVKTHGTGTAANNLAERTALQATLPDFVATSFKPTIGHTMGASGLLETVLLLRQMREGHVPAIANRSEADAVFLSSPVAPPPGLVLSLAAGMGNIYSAAVFAPMAAAR